MTIKRAEFDRHLGYFEKLAPKRIKQRKRHQYYWNEITNYINYFCHEEYDILEVGCGTGELLHSLKGKKKTGIDFSPEMVKMAREQYPDLDVRHMYAQDIQLDRTYDLIILSNLIGFLDDVQLVFEQLHKVCHERTKIIVTYYNYFWEPILKLLESAGLKPKTPIQNWLTLNDTNNLLYLAGFDVYRNTRRMLVPGYIPLISWLFNRYLAKLPLIRQLNLNVYTFAKPDQIKRVSDYQEKFSSSIVIPARNESGNIEQALVRMPSFGKHQEIIFVEGNSTDDTWETIQHIAKKYHHQFDIKIAQQDGKGKGDAVRKGFEMATGDILMILDADLTVPPEDLPKFYNAIASGKGDFINGSRLVYKMEKEAMRFLNVLGNKFFSITFSWLLERPFKDTLCGTKVIFREDYYRLEQNRSFFGEFDPFGDFDLIFGAHKLNLKIEEVPIRYRERTYGTTNISRFRHGFILLKMTTFAARKIKFI